jgi:hypothetical protein
MAFLALGGLSLIPEATSALGLSGYIEQIPVVGAGINTGLSAISSLSNAFMAPFNGIASSLTSALGLGSNSGIDGTTLLMIGGGAILVLILVLK